MPELAPTGDDDSEDELPELHDTAIGPGATGDDDDDDDYLPPPPTDADDELPPPPVRLGVFCRFYCFCRIRQR